MIELNLKNFNTALGDCVGKAFIQDYKVLQTKAGSDYIKGTLLNKGIIPFKIWGNLPAFSYFVNTDLRGTAISFAGSIDNYQGNRDVLIRSVAPDNTPIVEFMPVKYNADDYITNLKALLEKYLSQKGYSLISKILFDNTEILERFKLEFAARTHHDNCLSGLLAHTCKVTLNVVNILKMYPNLIEIEGINSTDYRDIILIGTVLHDIGKIKEMNYGTYTPESIVTHRYLGMELIYPYKEEIVSLYGDYLYYHMVSIVLQHHGEFAEPCRTVSSYIVHMADMLEAKLTSLEDSVTDKKKGDVVKLDELYLTL